MLLDYIIYLIAIFLIVVGTIQLFKAILLTVKKQKDQLALIIITYVLAVLFIAAGILAIIFRGNLKTGLNIAASIIVGVLLLVAGGYELYLGIKAIVGKNKTNAPKVKNNKKHKKEEPAPEEVKREEIKELDYTSSQIEQK